MNAKDAPQEIQPSPKALQCIEEMVDHGEAVIYQEQGVQVVKFKDGSDTIPLSELEYDDELGLYDKRQFPEVARRAGAPKGNQNATGHISPRKGKTGASRMMSMPHETWEAFKSACDLYAGHVLDDDDAYKDEWKRLSDSAVSAFIKRHQGLEDPSVYIM